MTGLLLHCKQFRYRDRSNSTRPFGIARVVEGRALTAETHKNAVVILTCIEEGDSDTHIALAAAHVDHMMREWYTTASAMVVLPFAHLSGDIAQPPAAMPSLTLFLQHLGTHGYRPSLATFGSHKDWMVDVYGYPRATSWFAFRQRPSLN